MDVTEFDEETQRMIEALAEGDDDKVVSLRSILGAGDPKDSTNGDPHSDDPDADHEDHSDDEDEEVQDEDPRSSSPAQWGPVSTKQARQFVSDHPEAAIDVIFPTVYEEDRSAKLKDVGTAQALGYISHQRAAEMVAKELGIDPFVYKEEMDQIQDENPPIDPPKKLGSGDQVAQGMLGPLAGKPAGPGQRPQTPGADLGGGMPGGDTGAPKIGQGGGGGMASEGPAQARILTPTGDDRTRRGADDVRGEMRDNERSIGRAEMNAGRTVQRTGEQPALVDDQPGGSRVADIGPDPSTVPPRARFIADAVHRGPDDSFGKVEQVSAPPMSSTAPGSAPTASSMPLVSSEISESQKAAEAALEKMAQEIVKIRNGLYAKYREAKEDAAKKAIIEQMSEMTQRIDVLARQVEGQREIVSQLTKIAEAAAGKPVNVTIEKGGTVRTVERDDKGLVTKIVEADK